MDVTSMLNQSASTCCKGAAQDTPPTLSPRQQKQNPTSLPTPSPDRMTPQQGWDPSLFKNRKPWSVGSNPLAWQSDGKYRSGSVLSFRSASENLDSDASCESFEGEQQQSRTGSVDSTSVDMGASHSWRASTRPEYVHRILREEQKAGVDAPDFPGNKTWGSNYNSPYFNCWRSGSYSRKSSGTTPSIYHDALTSPAELPLLETALLPCSDKYQMPTSARRAPQLSGRHSLTDQFENVGVSRRSGSPSDALLNVRGAIKCKHSEAPARNFEQTNSSKSHKRAASAPDISRLIDLEASQDPYAEVPSPSEVMVVAKQFNLQNLGRASHASLGMISTSSDAFAARAVPTEDDDGVQALPAPRHVQDSSPSTPHFHHDQKIVRQSSSLGEDEGETPVCMFVDDCDTGSQLRKAISHLFGRNKTCTLKIPKMVWVYYCRKHYQRVRYRNARTYPVTQMELVEAQIERLKAWSDENQARGKGAYIKSWTLSLRKREEKRLRGSKRAAEDEDDAAAAAAAAGPGPSSHIPSWILDELGAGFDTARMFSIADRLRQEIESGTLSQVPEIEFLPDIVDDDGERDSGKPARHRWQNGAAGAAKTPKRKAHEFAAATGRGAAPYQQAAVPWASHHGSDEVAGEPSPSGKRPRTARAATFPQHQPSPDLGGASAYIDGLPLHAYMAPGPCCGPSDPSGGPGGAHHGPPRALNVVPRMQPLEHHSLTVHPHHEPAAGRGEAFPNVDGAAGHARTASHQGAREAGSGPGAYAHHQVSGYSHQQQQPPPLPASRNSLPSIATQMQSGRVSGYSHVDAPPYGQGPPRLTHHRSASAYTPGSRLLSSTHGRPSASASAVPAADPRLPRQAATTRGGHALLPPPRDDAQHHRGPAYGEDARRRGQHDDGRQRCGPGWCTHLPRHYEHGVVPGGPDGAGGNPRAW